MDNQKPLEFDEEQTNLIVDYLLGKPAQSEILLEEFYINTIVEYYLKRKQILLKNP